jgi:hypothetical protein
MHIIYHRIICFVTKILAIPQLTKNTFWHVLLILTYSVHLPNILVIFSLYMYDAIILKDLNRHIFNPPIHNQVAHGLNV